jgi:hypothetical protein
MEAAKRSTQSNEPIDGRWLEIEEVRLVSDLRIMHAKVVELYQIVQSLRERHEPAAIRKYADALVLDRDIAQVDEIYLWFVALKEKR